MFIMKGEILVVLHFTPNLNFQIHQKLQFAFTDASRKAKTICAKKSEVKL